MAKLGSRISTPHIYRVLCVDDNEVGVFVNSVILRNEGYEVVACVDSSKVASIVQKQELDLAVLDYWLPGMNGAELAAICKAANPDIRVILFSGHLGIPTRELAMVDAFIPKSEGIQALLEGIRALLPRSKGGVTAPAKQPTVTNA
jgi:CheY-like chemotaxis protein